MYLPSHFEESDPTAISDLISDNPLGALVTLADGDLVADHIPFLFDALSGLHGTLTGHVARNNDLWRHHDSNREALVVFAGPSGYISPNWYQTKQETHQVVPTYNYLVVHMYGPLVVHDDPKWVRGFVGRLTKTMEMSEAKPWKMADAPRSFMDDQLSRIVGIEIPVTRVIGKWKASQNRPVADRHGVVEGLGNRASNADLEMAEAVRKSLSARGEVGDSAR